ncbi:MAG TPA: hypothetical protein PK689_00270 [Kiritimatiellia bacterium]|nr:hypothetical protein [Kiritimatiellia bacterium]
MAFPVSMNAAVSDTLKSSARQPPRMLHDLPLTSAGFAFSGFSTPWKPVFHAMEKTVRIFHAMENFPPDFPRYGKVFSTAWKTQPWGGR